MLRSCYDSLRGWRWRLGGAVAATLAATLLQSPSLAIAAPKHAAIVIDANTGTVLHDKFADEPRYPASLTKMMTLYLVFERLEQRRVSLASRIKVSEEAAAQPPSKLGLKPGDEISLDDAIRALVTKSANDVAVAVAEFMAGTEAKFAAQMTAKARSLGMTGTRFKNPHGLPDEEQVTTARDMITLGLALGDHFPRQWAFFSTQAFRWKGASHRNHNTLLYGFDGVDGIKTGYTRASGFNLVSSVRRGDKHLIAAVFGGSSAATRNAEMRFLLTRGLLKASARKTRVPAAALIASRATPPAGGNGVPGRKVADLPAGRDDQREASRQTARAASPSHPIAATPVERVVHRPEPRQDAPLEARPEMRAPAIEIARVRTVAVVPASGARPTVVSDAPFPAAPLRALPVEEPRREPRPSVASAPLHVVAMAPARAPSTLQAQASALNRTGSTDAEPPARYAAGASPAPGFGNRSALNGPAPSAAGAAGAGLMVQVGAYATLAEAERQLALARERGGSLLQGRAPQTVAGTNSGKTFYRARFGGFDVQTASQACSELRRRQIDCFVTRAE